MKNTQWRNYGGGGAMGAHVPPPPPPPAKACVPPGATPFRILKKIASPFEAAGYKMFKY